MEKTIKQYRAVLDALEEGAALLCGDQVGYVNEAGRAMLQEGALPQELELPAAGGFCAAGITGTVTALDEGVRLVSLHRVRDGADGMALPAGTLAATYGEILGDLQLATNHLDIRLGRSVDAPGCRDLLGMVERSCHRMLRLSRNLQLYDELRRGMRQSPQHLGDLFTFLHETAEEAAAYTFEAGRHLQADLPQKGAEGCFDQELCRELVYQLVVNAIQATSEDSVICLTAALKGRRVILTVEDRGRGIPEKKLPTVFQSFADGNRFPDAREGFGLGLALCRQIACFHGGSIVLSSTQGKGTRVTVSIPLREPESFVLRDSVNPYHRGEDYENGLVAMSDVLPSETYR